MVEKGLNNKRKKVTACNEHKAVWCLVSQMEGSDIEDDPVETEIIKEGEKDIVREESAIARNPLSQLDFYEEDPFAHCQSERMYQTWSLSD